MNDYVILTDATADHVEDVPDRYPFIDIIPMILNMEGEEYIYGGSDGNITCKEFYELERNDSYGHTSMISPAVYYSYFEKYLSKKTDVIYLSFSSGMSSTYQTACLVAEDLKDRYPDNLYRYAQRFHT